MVIRRIREHVAELNWLAVAVDLAIVVVGVFLGTQVSNWNSDRLDQAQADRFRARLVDELDFDSHQYAQQSAYYNEARRQGLAALADMEGRAPLSDRDFLVAAYQSTQTDTTHAKSGVYQELAASGLASRVGDEEAQQAGSDFYLTVDYAQRVLQTPYPYRDLLRETMPYDVQTAIRIACGDRSLLYRGRLVGLATVTPCPVMIDPAAAARAASIVRAAPDIRRQLTRYAAWISEILDNLELAREQANDFKQRLDGKM